MAEQPMPSPTRIDFDMPPVYMPQGASTLVMLLQTLEVIVSDGAEGSVAVTVPGFNPKAVASSSYSDVRSTLVSLVGHDFMQGRELIPRLADESDVLVRYSRTLGTPNHPTGRLKRRKLRVIRLEQCFYCGRVLPANTKRCVTRLGVTPRRATCYSVRSECPRSFAIGNARYTKDTHDSRLIITLAPSDVVQVIDAVPVVFTSP